MKRFFTVALSILSLAIGGVNAGDLEPPGPPGPTMKTLVEVEPRIAINTVNTPGNSTASYVIESPGSYYLAVDLAGESGKIGLSIQASNVTVDLMGFSVKGTTGATDGIFLAASAENVSLRNGVVREWPGHGVRFDGHGTLLDIRAVANGGDGIRVNGYTAIRHCEARLNVGAGIRALGGFNLIEGSVAMGNHGDGVVVAGGNRVTSNHSVSNGCGAVGGGSSANFHIQGSGSYVSDNFAFENTQNYNVETGGNIIVRNVAKVQPGCASSVNYVVASGNFFSTSSDASLARPYDNIDLP